MDNLPLTIGMGMVGLLLVGAILFTLALAIPVTIDTWREDRRGCLFFTAFIAYVVVMGLFLAIGKMNA